MTTPIAFTDNVRDLSNRDGFQFEFRCERCGNGYRSAFQPDMLERGKGLLRTVGGVLGGRAGHITNMASSWAMDRGTNSAAKDKALGQAVAEVAHRFEQCRGCGQWVCGDVCWNGEVGQCARCSPIVAEQLAQLQADARERQLRERLADTDLVGSLSLERQAVVLCPSCGARAEGGKFCGECGSALALVRACSGCGHENPSSAKFCAECGTNATA